MKNDSVNWKRVADVKDLSLAVALFMALGCTNERVDSEEAARPGERAVPVSEVVHKRAETASTPVDNPYFSLDLPGEWRRIERADGMLEYQTQGGLNQLIIARNGWQGRALSDTDRMAEFGKLLEASRGVMRSMSDGQAQMTEPRYELSEGFPSGIYHTLDPKNRVRSAIMLRATRGAVLTLMFHHYSLETRPESVRILGEHIYRHVEPKG